MGRALAALILCGIGALGIAGFRHYNESYAPRLRPGEGWLHMQPRFYEEMFAESAATFRDHVYLGGMPGAEAAVLTQTDPLWASVTVKGFRRDYREAMARHFAGASFSECAHVRTDETLWNCLDMRVADTETDTAQRSYFARRGNSNILVVFTATPPERFSYFGDPRTWLADLEWSGPSIAYAF